MMGIHTNVVNFNFTQGNLCFCKLNRIGSNNSYRIPDAGRILIGAAAVTQSLEEIHTNGNNMGTGTIGNNFIQNDLIRISEVKVRFLVSRLFYE